MNILTLAWPSFWYIRKSILTTLSNSISDFESQGPYRWVNQKSKYAGLFFLIEAPFTKCSTHHTTVYGSLFEQHLNYCNTIWSNTFPSYLGKLLALEKKITRAVSWSKFDAPTYPHFFFPTMLVPCIMLLTCLTKDYVTLFQFITLHMPIKWEQSSF